MNNLKVFSGSANPALAEAIAAYLGKTLGEATLTRFPDGESFVKINEHVRGQDTYIVQPTCAPQNDTLMELLLFIDAAHRASAERVTAVIPYFGYARQDRKDEGRVPISAKLVANMLQAAGADRVLTVHLHAYQIQGFFDIPVDHLLPEPVFTKHFLDLNLENLVVVSPDVGNVKMARIYADHLEGGLAIIDKERLSGREVRAGALIGNVENCNVLMVDDMITSAGTICKAANLLREHGARDIYVAATHAVLTDDAMPRICQSALSQIVVSDTIPLRPEAAAMPIFKQLSIAQLLGEAIKRIHLNKSVSQLFFRKKRSS
jgi:ribose-phosphate pyrophosphokinase